MARLPRKSASVQRNRLDQVVVEDVDHPARESGEQSDGDLPAYGTRYGADARRDEEDDRGRQAGRHDPDPNEQ
jgi:hypothetical protein